MNEFCKPFAALKPVPDILSEEMRKTAAAKTPDKKTGRLAKRFCEQCFQITDVRIVDNRSVVGPNLDFTFTDELAVIGVVSQMCDAYGLTLDIEKRKQDWIVTIWKPNDHNFTARPFATSPILRRAVLLAAIYAHSTYVAPALRKAQGGAPTPAAKQRMQIPQFNIPGCAVMVEYPAGLTDDEAILLRSKIDGCLRPGPGHEDD
jgi:hypothetical protein